MKVLNFVKKKKLLYVVNWAFNSPEDTIKSTKALAPSMHTELPVPESVQQATSICHLEGLSSPCCKAEETDASENSKCLLNY